MHALFFKQTLIHIRFGALRPFFATISSQNLEIHKVFLRFFIFIVTKKPSQFALAE